ncbi:NEL-type E3 ubiquitin ligase domain-containing protein [Pseudomonas atagonensis]|uniref:NEL-type E3 ubiquitin ligase domain-containing protein n=1 Tax=Pseudomonas atagonensis TaxID=2609964 RepID=UPI001408BAF8|nr:NEL-type E3 ubiquitin ligase domain-containing protein [Pseudomonas atagonensis]
MSRSLPEAVTTNVPAIHFQTVKNAIPPALLKASASRRAALKSIKPTLPDWYTQASDDQRAQLKSYTDTLHRLHNERDALFNKIRSIEDFAKDLLLPELQKLDGQLDPDKTWLRLYAPKSLGIFGLKSEALTVKTFSLLQAALHNFEDAETAEGYYDASSGFITPPDHQGHFERFTTSVPVEAFTTLCRRLDVGAQYQTYLKDFLRPANNALADSLLRKNSTEYRQQALKTAAYLALMKKDIDAPDFEHLMKVVNGERIVMDGNKQVRVRSLSIMGLHLSDCLLFIPCERNRYHGGYLIAWIPDDPEHPLKKYASFEQFNEELTRQLSDRPAGSSIGPDAGKPTAYQLFFSRFVAQRDRPYYFRRFSKQATDGPAQSLISKWRRHELVKLSERLLMHVDVPEPRDTAIRLDPQQAPDFDITDHNLKGKGLWEDVDLWPLLHDIALDKIIDDARVLAVPTADEDAKTRAERWANYLNIGFVALGAFALVVPGLGELMLLATAGQLLYEVFEGAVELSEGDRQAGWAHITDVIENLATAVALAPVFHFTVTPFIESLKTVAMPGGKTRLHKPDLARYRYKGSLPQEANSDANGLYQHDGKTLLKLDEHLYAVAQDPHTAELKMTHPSRPDAYSPTVKHNGAGSYVLEGETPHTWDNQTLMRRLGSSVERFSDSQLEQIRQTSGTTPEALRRMYRENAAPAPLLTDTVQRFVIAQDVQTAIERLGSGDLQPSTRADSLAQLQVIEADGLWPDGVPMRVIDQRGNTLWQSAAAKTAQGKKLVVELTDGQISKGLTLKTVMQTLDGNDTPILLDIPAGTGVAIRTEQLRAHIATVAEQSRRALFHQRYSADPVVQSEPAKLLHAAVADLPATLSEPLLATATAAELDLINQHRHMPLHLKNQARQLQREARTTHAWQGFHHEWLINTDTERLALNALRLHSDALADLRIEIRQDSVTGELNCSVGAQDAATVKVLVKSADRQYAVFDQQGQSLHEPADLFRAILEALTPQQRRNLGYASDDGTRFKQWIMAKTEPSKVRQILLADPPVSPVVQLQSETLLGGAATSRDGITVEEKIQELYPHFRENEVDAFARDLLARGNAMDILEQANQDLDELRVTLSKWRYRYLVEWDATLQPHDHLAFLREGGQHIADRLLECFERRSMVFGERNMRLEGGYILNLSSRRMSYDLELWWKKLPDIKKYLDRITTVSLDNMRFSENSDGLLKDFRHLRQLSARGCELKTLPDGVAHMHLLETLRLSDNQIRLTPQSVEHLKNLTRMQTLRLDDNPLGERPDVGRMPRLGILGLNNTGLTTWPEGLFNKVRPRQFFLNMLDNPINLIPEVVPGSDQAFIIARTRLLAVEFSDFNRTRYESYRVSVGLTPQHVYSQAATDLLNRWPVRTGSWFTGSPGLGIYRPEAWPDLGSEPNSRRFFQIIDGLRGSADYRNGGAGREQLGERVWRMIHAMDIDTGLREELFDMAVSPVRCEDAGAQVFNQMGIKVLAAEARLSSTSAEPLERKLASLAKGAARLDRVNEIARADVMSRGGNPDVVEVYLAYQTGLSERLDLPWQSKNMRYRLTAGVEQWQLDQAFETVMAMEISDGLVNGMLEQPFWTDYLREAHADEYYANRSRFELKASQLEDLRDAMAELAPPSTLASVHKIEARSRLRTLASQLGVPQEQVLTGRPMEDAVYERLITDFGDQEKELSRQQTRDALKKNGL